MSTTAIEHGQTYRFMSVFDQGFLDLSNRVTEKGNKLMTWEGNTSNAQKFRAEVQDGYFHILSLCRKKGEPHRVVEQSATDLDSGIVHYWDLNDGDSQFWYLEPVDKDCVLIRNKGSGKALSNQGRSEQVKCIAADHNDIHQKWKLIISDHFQAGNL
jgi:hypothetical protein